MPYAQEKEELLLNLSLPVYESLIVLAECPTCSADFDPQDGILIGEDLVCSEYCVTCEKE